MAFHPVAQFHGKSARTCMRAQAMLVAAGVLAVICAAALVGCSNGGHKIVSSRDACITCHSERSAVELDPQAQPQNAQPANPNALVTVNAAGKQVYLCEPLFTDERGSHYVPLKVRTLSAEECASGIQLEEGFWVVAAEDGSATNNVLLSVSASNDAANVALKL